ncbi:hypothetical protein AV540_20335 [Brevibacillus parabrevis]|uniref:hypothetical protein n=1 Tax=Brevibacillus parabrevis TaxID=54914 RepID=UPI0007AB24CC|nr:hypothetical protein [Brevibacillus parabrevis]KZE47148.1 hypothetical protein AV540_20335 [Brevibacillus parabrevis]
MFVHRTKKLLVLTLGSLAILSAGSFFGYQAYADDSSKTEMLEQMKDEYQKLADQDDPNAPSEERQKIKDLGWEIGKLEKELNPENPEDVLARKLAVFKEMTLIHESSYKDSDADANDPKVTKIVEQIEQRKQLVAKFEEKLASLKNRAKKAKHSEEAKGEAEQLLAEFQQEKEAISIQSE